MIRSLIPTSLKPSLRRARSNIEGAMLCVFSSNRFLAGLYYFLFDRSFDREHLAVLRGRRAYLDSLGEMKHSSALLRRNIHRIEKGLIMRPRRQIFAEGFVQETVDCYLRAESTPGFSESELRWATHVLEEYFDVVGHSQVIDSARGQFQQLRTGDASDKARAGHRLKPYPLAMAPATDISYEKLLRLFLRRRSVRWYQAKRVDPELIHRAIAAAALAPSACNRQPFRFLLSTDPKRSALIASCAGGTVGFADNFQSILVLVGDLSAYPFERDRHLIYIDSALAAMQLMLAAETLGLSTCPINWPDIEEAERRIHGLLGLPPQERVIMLLAIGYGDSSGEIPYSQKKSVHELTRDLDAP
jgi:nitroreductase